jgi:hypothetical protein
MMTGAFKATYVFGCIVACMFVIFFLVLVAAPSEFVGECKQGVWLGVAQLQHLPITTAKQQPPTIPSM